MICEVKEYFGLKKEFDNAGYFETESYRQTFLDLKAVIGTGRLVALTGVVGSGKTTAARQIRKDLKKENKVLVSTNLAVDKHRVNLTTLIFSLFADMATEKDYKIPARQELRERQLRELIEQRKKPVALFIDEAHDLHHKTLVGLKRLIEIIQDAGCVLSIVLIGHPKLRIDLNRPSLEEIGARITILKLEGIKGQEAGYFQWLLSKCAGKGVKAEDIFSREAMDLISERLHTPLQINSYAWKALAEAHRIGQKPVKADTLEAVISKDLNDLEARVCRYGYDMKSLSETIDARPAEIRAFLRGRLASGRSQELKNEILKLGVAG